MFKGKKVLVIGGTGTIGQSLIDRILSEQPSVVRIYSRDEYKQFVLKERLGERPDLRYLIGDVRDKERLDRAMHSIDIVFNLAALKHVPSCEYNPYEAVKTNVIGTQNVIDCAMENKVKKVVYTSSDKSVSPTNTMGATKLLAERLMTSAYYARGHAGTVFSSVRFGNVMGSRGSVIPLFRQQILENGYITITEPEMTRFMMTLTQAVELTIKACATAKGGEVFVLKMPVMKLKDFAEAVVAKVCEKEKLDPAKIEIRRIGLRPGEKLYEELMSEDEASKALEMDDMYIVPSIFEMHGYDEAVKAKIGGYSSNSQRLLNKDEIEKMLDEESLI